MSRRTHLADLTDSRRAILELYARAPRPGESPAKQPCREIVEAALYVVLRGAIAWRLFPHVFPPWQTVYD